MKINKKPTLAASIIIPTYNGEKTLKDLANQIIQIFKNISYEIIIINDCSPDKTHAICLDLIKNYPKHITYLKFGKNLGEHNAVMAGLKNSTADHVIIIDDDFQNPPDQVLKIFEFTKKNNFDIVYTYYDKKNHNFFRNFLSRINDLTANIVLGKSRGLYLSSFKCLKRNIVNKISEYDGPYPYIDGLILGISSNIGSIKTDHNIRKIGKSGYSLSKLLRLYLSMLTNFSTLPIHISSVIGIIISLVSGLYAFYTVIHKILNPGYPIGYTSVFTAIIFFSGIQLIFMGLLGEYIGKILKNVNKEPQFFLEYKKIRENIDE